MSTDTEPWEVFRQTNLGKTLMDSLDALIMRNRIDGDLAKKVVKTFDKAILQVLTEKSQGRMALKGGLHYYRAAFEVYNFSARDVRILLCDGEQIRVERLRVVALPGKMPSRPLSSK